MATGTQGERQEIKVITWNGNHGSGNGSGMAGFTLLQQLLVMKLIEKYQDYYICLQEVEMSRNFRTKIIQQVSGIKIRNNNNNKVSIICKEEVTSNDKIRINGDGAYMRYIEVEFENFVLISCHAKHKNETDKEQKLKEFFEQKKEEHRGKTIPVIIAGDFNLELQNLENKKDEIEALAHVFPSQSERKRQIDFFTQVKINADKECLTGTEEKISFRLVVKFEDVLNIHRNPNITKRLQEDILGAIYYECGAKPGALIVNQEHQPPDTVCINFAEAHSEIEKKFTDINAYKSKLDDDKEKIQEEIKRIKGRLGENHKTEFQLLSCKLLCSVAKEKKRFFDDDYYKYKAISGKEAQKTDEHKKSIALYEDTKKNADECERAYIAAKYEHENLILLQTAQIQLNKITIKLKYRVEAKYAGKITDLFYSFDHMPLKIVIK